MAKTRKTSAPLKTRLKHLTPAKDVKGGKQKSWNPANFRIKQGGLP